MGVRRSTGTLPLRLILALSLPVDVVVGFGLAEYGGQSHQLFKFVGGIIALLILVAAATRPQAALVAYVAMSPVDLPNTLLGAHVRISDELLIAVAAIFVPRIVTALPSIPRSLRWALALLVVGAWLSVLVAQNKPSATLGAVRYTAFAVILIVGVHLARDNPKLRGWIGGVFIGAASVTAIFGLLQGAGHTLVVGRPYLVGLPNSFLGYYTDYAAFLGLGFAVAAAYISHRRPVLNLKTVALYLSTVLLLYSILEAKSRGGLLIVVVALVVAALGRGSLPTQPVRLVIIGVIALATFYVIPTSIKEPILQRVTNHSLTSFEDNERHHAQRIGLTELRKHPLGIGYGNFYLYEPANVTSQGALFHDQETFYQLGLDAGWSGLAGFSLIGIAVIGRLVGHRTDGSVVAGAAGLAGLGAQGLNDYIIYDSSILISAAFMLILVFGSSRIRSSPANAGADVLRQDLYGQLASAAPVACSR